jgi:acyl carrier protein
MLKNIFKSGFNQFKFSQMVSNYGFAEATKQVSKDVKKDAKKKDVTQYVEGAIITKNSLVLKKKEDI